MKVDNYYLHASSISCYNWEVLEGAQNKVRISNGTFVYDSGDTSHLVRLKLPTIFAFAIFGFPLLRFPARCICLLMGTWGKSGYEKAKTLWMQHCVNSYRKKLHPPSKTYFYQASVICVLSELVKDVVKCITLPLAIIGICFACTWGMISPYDGRKLVGTIENLWAIDLPVSTDQWKMQRMQVINYIALCMQDTGLWKRKNLFHLFHDYNGHTFRSLLLSLETLEKKGINPIPKFEQNYQKWKDFVKKMSPKDTLEVYNDGSLCPDENKTWIRDKLISILNLCDQINDAIVKAAEQGEEFPELASSMSELENLFDMSDPPYISLKVD